MAGFLSSLSTAFKLIDQLLDRLSDPKSKHNCDKIEYEIMHIRCKALLTTQLGLLLLFVCDMLLNRSFFSTSLARVSSCVFLIALLIISCRYCILLLKIFSNICYLCYGPYIMNLTDGGIHRAWFLAIVFPLYIYLFIGDWKCFLVQIAIHAAFVNKLYNPIMERTLKHTSPEEYMKNLTYATNLCLVFCIVLVLFTHYFMVHAYKRIAVVERKKDEIENQKTFLLSFSHELRNLINSLTGNVKLASLETVASKTKELLLNAEVCGELLLHLVNNILDTAKVEIGELEINPVPTRIYEILERVWAICSELIKRKNLGGRIRISRTIPTNLMIDHYRLTQIFLNLVENAVKFTETGSIDISVDWLDHIEEDVSESCFRPYPFNSQDDHDEGLFEKQKTFGVLDQNSFILGLNSHKINASLLKTNNNNNKKGVLKIVVSDTGYGMSEEEINKLFQKFTQVTPDTSKRKLGTGLGLFITKELCHRMKGDIKAFSKKNSGSVFILCIPVDIAQQEMDLINGDLNSVAKFIKSKKLKAMIVDDVLFNHQILKTFFEKLGIEVYRVATNGLEAFHRYSELIEKGERLDIVTMDIEMPVMDGKESARKIRKLEAEKGIRPCFMPIISANCSESEIAECLDKSGQMKADRFIKKPATLEELLRAIAHHFAALHNDQQKF